MPESNIQYAWSDAGAYEAFMGRWSELLAPTFIDFTGLAAGAHVLDVACGTGVLSKALAEAGASVIGVDASARYLAGARSHRTHPKITYQEGDIRQMQFTDNSFDTAVSTLALDVLPEIEQVVSEMIRGTRPGGICSLGRDSVPRWNDCVRPHDQHSGRTRCQHPRSPRRSGGPSAILAGGPDGVVVEDGQHARRFLGP